MIELHPDAFPTLLPSLRRLPVNHLFARSVLERHVDGRVWLARKETSMLCHVVHPYGMTLMFGDGGGTEPHILKAHLDECRDAAHDLWLQVTPAGLAASVDELLAPQAMPADQPPGGPRVQRYTRANFRFDPARHAALRVQLAPPPQVKIRPIAAQEFALPDISVSPHRFWRDVDQFFAHGGGWCVEQDGNLAAMAFCSFRFDRQLEIGVETRADYRKRGYAYHAARALVDQCLALGLEPIWSCRKENTGSYRLAQSLGFEPTLEVAYYRLPAGARPHAAAECV